MIERPPLLAALEGRRGFVAIMAAAGSGKTTLLRQWEAADPRPFVWVAPDDAGEVQRLASLLTDAAAPFVLVLDDIHRHPDAGSALLGAITGLTLPPGVGVAVAGRELERRAHSRLRLRPELIEISDAELALDVPAATTVLGDGVDEATVRRLVRQTDGWAAGLQLARIFLGRSDSEEFTGADRLVREYVETEVLDELDADLIDFMLGCAPFEELTGPFCDAVLGVTDAQARLELLERRHLFMAAIDREGQRFRWQPLVREALAAELLRRDPSRARRLRTAGADWLAEHGAAREALALRLANGDREQALQLLSEVVLPMFYGGSLDQIVDIIHDIGPDIAVTHGYLATMFAYAGMMTGDAVCARRWTRAAGDFYLAHSFGDIDEQVAFLTLRAHLCADGVHRMRLDADAARVRVKESSPWRAPALMLSGIAAGLCGDTAAAAATLDEAIHVSRESGAVPALVLALAERLELSTRRATEQEIDEAVQAAQSAPYAHYPHSALSFALRAESAAAAGDHRAARAALASANAFRPVLGREMPWLAVQVRLHVARAMAALGDVVGARVVLAEAEEVLVAMPDPGVLSTRASDLARVLRPLGDAATTGASLLTTAELRLLPLLTSHLSFEEIGERLHLSRNTIKTQAASVYRKLGVSSRSEAVEHAARLGLVDA
ncbi:LuxR C-terminal-related transcriptional regulator [Microbacterium sp. cf046]|uniref:LuxR C-terminal-related transcriptional regulator n=1 Tax=Microbacterium sp. cf046 TaxID=1761803 RepID=UPI00111337A9|nr:LuxR C-terminal-related transcriptional regulator [Microbacterium sp. cf046]